MPNSKLSSKIKNLDERSKGIYDSFNLNFGENYAADYKMSLENPFLTDFITDKQLVLLADYVRYVNECKSLEIAID